MRADIHGGPEHDTLQYEAGYIDARPTSDRSTKTSCDARPDHTSGPISDISRHNQSLIVLSYAGSLSTMKVTIDPSAPNMPSLGLQ